jgi:hypothetical protein
MVHKGLLRYIKVSYLCETWIGYRKEEECTGWGVYSQLSVRQAVHLYM